MHASYLERVSWAARHPCRVVATNDALRRLLSTREFAPLAFSSHAQDAALGLKYGAPQLTAWRAMEWANAMTFIYGAYERFVYDLLREWLGELPNIVQDYSALDAGVRKSHQQGIAEVLKKKDHRRYQHLPLGSMLRDLANACDGQRPYQLLPEAFFSAAENLRKEPLEALFGRVGLNRAWQWISNHSAVVDFITESRGDGATAESGARGVHWLP